MYVCMYVCMYVRMYLCICIDTHIHMYMYINMHTDVYILLSFVRASSVGMAVLHPQCFRAACTEAAAPVVREPSGP